MPRAPPVTTATLPLNERGVLDMVSIMASRPTNPLVLCSGSQEGAARDVRGERPDVAVDEHRPPVRLQLEARITALLDRPLLLGREPADERLAVADPRQRRPQQLTRAVVVERREQAQLAV